MKEITLTWNMLPMAAIYKSYEYIKEHYYPSLGAEVTLTKFTLRKKITLPGM